MIKKILVSLIFVCFTCFCVYQGQELKKTRQNLVAVQESYEQGKYISVNLDKEIKDLKKENRALYDSIKEYKNEITFLSQFKYEKEYVIDTVFVKEPLKEENVKTFTYSNNSDTIDYTLNIGSAQEPNWYNLKFKLKDELTIINRNNDNGLNKTTIESTNNANIENVTVFNKKQTSFNDKLSHGITIGGGYGLINKKLDIYLGYGFTYNF